MCKCPLTSFHLSLSLLASSFSLFIASSSTLERMANRPIGGHVFKAAEWNEVVCEERRGGGLQVRVNSFTISPIELNLCILLLVSICLERVGIRALCDRQSQVSDPFTLLSSRCMCGTTATSIYALPPSIFKVSTHTLNISIHGLHVCLHHGQVFGL